MKDHQRSICPSAAPEVDRLDELFRNHPRLFAGRLPEAPSHLPSGWYDVVDQLCHQIEATLGKEDCPTFQCLQIKEKFGTLRFYFRSEQREAIDAYVEAACNQTALLCPVCGADVRHPIQVDAHSLSHR